MLSICDVIVRKKVPMENENSISLGGTIISGPLYEKGIKKLRLQRLAQNLREANIGKLGFHYKIFQQDKIY